MYGVSYRGGIEQGWVESSLAVGITERRAPNAGGTIGHSRVNSVDLRLPTEGNAARTVLAMIAILAWLRMLGMMQVSQTLGPLIQIFVMMLMVRVFKQCLLKRESGPFRGPIQCSSVQQCPLGRGRSQSSCR